MECSSPRACRGQMVFTGMLAKSFMIWKRMVSCRLKCFQWKTCADPELMRGERIQIPL